MLDLLDSFYDELITTKILYELAHDFAEDYLSDLNDSSIQ